MNFTDNSSTFPGPGKRINWQALTLAGGLALALGAAAIVGAFEREHSPATTAVSQPGIEQYLVETAPLPGTRAQSIVFIVTSEAEKAALLESFHAMTWHDPALNIGGAILAVDLPAQEALYHHMLAEQMGGAELTLIDARPGAPSAGASLHSPAH